jgi:hypothetical protein
LYATHRIGQLTGIENVCHHDLSAATLEENAPRISDPNGGPYWPPLSQQLPGDGATGPSGRADNKNFWVSHKEKERNNIASTVRYRTLKI